MRIGIGLDERNMTLDEVIGWARATADAGLTGLWLGEHRAWDPLTTLALAAREAPGIELGTAVVLTYAQHPLTMASQALTVQAASGNRLLLGVGPSHAPLIEGQYGHSFDRPARHVREYLEVLGPLLRGEQVAYAGETVRAAGGVTAPGATAPPLLLAALGPVMLRIAGELADGTVLAWAGPAAIENHVVPLITRAAAAAGRPAPRVQAMPLVIVTDDVDDAYRRIGEEFGVAASMPSYRAILDQGGADDVTDVVVVGDEKAVERELRRYADAGATDVVAMLFGNAEERRRTLDVMSGLVDERAPA
jgi:F420-dependent oxidoreductase-like protein